MRLTLLLIASLFSITPVAYTAKEGTVTFSEDRMERAQEELERRREVREWIREESPVYKEILKAKYEPLIEANKSDYERNMKLARRFRSRADETDSTDRRKQYMQIAKLFRAYAKQNRRIVVAIRKGNGDALHDAFDKIKKIEKEIYNVSERNYEREWFTPEELQQAAQQLRNRRQPQREDEN